MNHQNKFLLPDKSFWQALNREQREALISKYTILCPTILFTEIARHGLSPRNPWLNLENIIDLPHWLEYAKMDLLTDESSQFMLLGSASTMKSICESSEEERLALEKTSSENIEMLKESEEYIKSLVSIINPLKEKLLGLVNNPEDLSDEEWVDRLKQVTREFQAYYPKIKHTLKKIDAEDFPHERIKSVKESLEALCDTYRTDTLANAYQVAEGLLGHDPSDRTAAHEILQRLCMLSRSILTQEERTQIFNRFLKEGMPPIRKFAPYALGAMIWNLTIQLYLRENPQNAAPNDVLRDAQYLLYTSSEGITFVSGDKWHRKVINEVPLFEKIRENFIFVNLMTKETIQEGFSKLL